MTRAGAPLGALLRRSPYGIGPRFQRRHAPPSASSWQGIVVPPGGAPTPPGCRLRAGSAGAAPARGPELPGAGCRILGPVLRSRLRPAPPPRRLMMAPLGEQGARRIREVLEAGITFFSRSYPCKPQATRGGSANRNSPTLRNRRVTPAGGGGGGGGGGRGGGEIGGGGAWGAMRSASAGRSAIPCLDDHLAEIFPPFRSIIAEQNTFVPSG